MKTLIEHLNKISVKKIVGLKFEKEVNKKYSAYPQKDIWCKVFDEVLKNKTVFLTTLENHKCGSGSVYSGLGRSRPLKEVLPELIKKLKLKNEEVLLNINSQIPKMPDFKAAIIGEISKIDDPDILLVLCNLKQADRIAKAYAFEHGELIKGIAGANSCAIIPFCYTEKKAFFNIPEKSGLCVGVEDDELMLAIPKNKIQQLVNGFTEKEKLEVEKI